MQIPDTGSGPFSVRSDTRVHNGLLRLGWFWIQSTRPTHFSKTGINSKKINWYSNYISPDNPTNRNDCLFVFSGPLIERLALRRIYSHSSNPWEPYSRRVWRMAVVSQSTSAWTPPLRGNWKRARGPAALARLFRSCLFMCVYVYVCLFWNRKISCLCHGLFTNNKKNSEK